jgi:hypothetical protein
MIKQTKQKAYLNGAKFCTPSSDTVDTNATGRGMTALVSNLYIAPLSELSGCQVFQPCSASAFHTFPFAASSRIPSRHAQPGSGDCVGFAGGVGSKDGSEAVAFVERRLPIFK